MAAGLLVEGAKVGQLARRNQHPTRVHAHVAGQALEFLGQGQQGFDLVFFGQALGQDRLNLERTSDGDVLPGLVGDELGDAIAKGVTHVQNPPHVADGGARGHGAKGGNLTYRIAPIFVLDVVDHPVSVELAKVNIKVGHGHPVGVQKTLKQQLVLQRIQVGDVERIGHQRAGSGATPRPHRAAIVFGPVDEVTHDQKVAWEAHFDDGGDLKRQALVIGRALALALGRVRKQALQPGLQAALRGLAEIRLFGHAIRCGVNGQAGLAQIEGDAAAFGDFHRIGQGRGHIGKGLFHLGAGLEILLAGEAAHPALVAQNFTFGNAHPRLVGFVVIGLQILHRMGGHHRQLQAGGQLHRFAHMQLIIRAATALQLQIKAMRKNCRPLQGHVAGPLAVALHQGLAHVAHLRARQSQQAR